MLSNQKKLIVIVGPTASGKSDLAVKIAKKIGGEIISADSRQVYRGLDIGSGKMTKKEMRGITHYCLDVVSPRKIFTAEDFKKCFNEAIEKIYKKNKTPILVGGTGFYIDVALGRIEIADVSPNPTLRKKLEKKSAEELFKMLKKMDPKRSKNIDSKNPVRLVRAIEIANFKPHPQPLSFVRRGGRGINSKPLNGFFGLFGMVSESGQQADEEQKGTKSERRKSELGVGFSAGRPRMSEEALLVSPTILWIGIKRPKEELKKRIHERLIKRLPGIIKEIKKLRDGGVSWKRLFDLGLEYRYVSLFVRRKIDKKYMIEKLETEINRYAKRQMTWFKKNKKIHWIKNEKEAGDFTGPLLAKVV